MISSKRQAIREKIAQLEAEEKELLTKERPEALSKVLELIAEYEFTVSELQLAPVKNRQPKPSKLKPGATPYYRNPQDHSQVAHKKGPRPEWLKQALKEGKKLESFIIE